MGKFKRGRYVRINGEIFAITGARQRAELASNLDGAGVRGGPWPITYWDGQEWQETGLVWHHASRGKAYTLAAGRQIYRDGQPLCEITRHSHGVKPWQVDALSHVIVKLLNDHEAFVEDYMANYLGQSK